MGWCGRMGAGRLVAWQMLQWNALNFIINIYMYVCKIDLVVLQKNKSKQILRGWRALRLEISAYMYLRPIFVRWNKWMNRLWFENLCCCDIDRWVHRVSNHNQFDWFRHKKVPPSINFEDISCMCRICYFTSGRFSCYWTDGLIKFDEPKFSSLWANESEEMNQSPSGAPLSLTKKYSIFFSKTTQV